MGLNVEKLPEGGGMRMADFRACDAQQSYLVEVTDRAPDRQYREFLKEVNEKRFATVIRTMDRSKTLDRKVEDKADQLAKTPREADFKTLWITALHDDALHLCEALQRTLYGMADLLGVRRDNDPSEFPPTPLMAFYYDDFAFSDCRDVDGVAFVSNEAVSMFVNPLCPRVAEFKRSKLCHGFAQKGALFDPAELGDHPDILFLDYDADRSNPRVKWDAVRKKYGWHTTQTRDSCWQGMIAIPAPAASAAALRQAHDKVK